MVNSPWKGQCSPCPGVEKQIRPYHFERSQWQSGTEPNLWYLLWRWCLAVMFVSICIYSICNPTLRADNSNNSLWKWPAFLTNWAYTVCTIQAILGLWIVQCSWINKTDPKEMNRQLPKVYHIYWAMNNLAVDMALVVSLIYWTLVHDSSVHRLDALNFLVHAANSAMMMTDLFLVMHPTRLIYILNAFGLGVIYIVFSYIYFALGGTDRDGRPFIYAALDWRKPGRAVCFTLLCLTILAVIHCVAYCFYRLRVRLAYSTNYPTPLEMLTPQEKPMLVELA